MENYNYLKEYQSWVDADINNELNEDQIEPHFGKHLSFGTAGMRGIMGPGTNRMNVHTVAWATEGFARNLKNNIKNKPIKVVIGFDVRYMSKRFSAVAAGVLANAGIKVYLFPYTTPTPLVSYAIRHLKADGGIMITASHNTSEYNGYKVYNEAGAQITEQGAEKIVEIMNELNIIEIETEVQKENTDNIKWISPKILNSYVDKIVNISYQDDLDKDLPIVFSPLNGTGLMIEDVLIKRGYNNIHTVKQERNPDPAFSTTKSPNPENPKVFKLAEELGRTTNAEILLATDPDADRIGVEVLHNGEYVFLTGNKLGLLLTDYVLKNNKVRNGHIVKTIVTGNLVDKMALEYGIQVHDVFVGFKNIYEKLNVWDSQRLEEICGVLNNEQLELINSNFDLEEILEIANETQRIKINEIIEKSEIPNLIIGFEESFGFGLTSFVRDKDAVSAAAIIVEMTAYYRKQGKNLIEVLNEIYNKYGYVKEITFSVNLDNDFDKTKRVMDSFRENPINNISNLSLLEIKDYLKGPIKNNTLIAKYSNNNWFAIRPSGTEPKIKFYVYGYNKDLTKATLAAKSIETEIRKRIETIN